MNLKSQFKIEAIVTDDNTDPKLQYTLEELQEEIRNYLNKGLFLKIESLSVRTHQV